VFRPTDAEIEAARRVVEAARGADRRGVGAFLVDGRMIDIPFIKRAESILGAAHRLGLLGAPDRAGHLQEREPRRD
jgi:citrate lyase subunit beta/citryl-CoA lyase